MPSRSANTHRSHSTRNIFQSHSDSATVQQPQGGVWQDKPRPPHDRTASPQPAPPPNVMRPQETNSNPARSQKRSVPKRKTVHLTLWVKPMVKAELERRAGRDGVSVSATGGAFLEKALQEDIDMQYGAMLQPI